MADYWLATTLNGLYVQGTVVPNSSQDYGHGGADFFHQEPHPPGGANLSGEALNLFDRGYEAYEGHSRYVSPGGPRIGGDIQHSQDCFRVLAEGYKNHIQMSDGGPYWNNDPANPEGSKGSGKPALNPDVQAAVDRGYIVKPPQNQIPSDTTTPPAVPNEPPPSTAPPETAPPKGWGFPILSRILAILRG